MVLRSTRKSNEWHLKQTGQLPAWIYWFRFNSARIASRKHFANANVIYNRNSLKHSTGFLLPLQRELLSQTKDLGQNLCISTKGKIKNTQTRWSTTLSFLQDERAPLARRCHSRSFHTCFSSQGSNDTV